MSSFKGKIWAELLEDFLRQIDNVAEEAILSIEPDAWRLKMVDPAHVEMVVIDLNKTDFEEYKLPDGPFTIGLPVDKFLDFMKHVTTTKDMVGVQIADEEKEVGTVGRKCAEGMFTIEVGNLQRTMCALDSAGLDEPEIPKLTHIPVEITTTTQTLYDFIRAMPKEADVVAIYNFTHDVLGRSWGMYGAVGGGEKRRKLNELRLPYSGKSPSDNFTWSQYPADYFIAFVKALVRKGPYIGDRSPYLKPKREETRPITLLLGTDYPLRMVYHYNRGSTVRYLLAPRILGEDFRLADAKAEVFEEAAPTPPKPRPETEPEPAPTPPPEPEPPAAPEITEPPQAPPIPAAAPESCTAFIPNGKRMWIRRNQKNNIVETLHYDEKYGGGWVVHHNALVRGKERKTISIYSSKEKAEEYVNEILRIAGVEPEKAEAQTTPLSSPDFDGVEKWLLEEISAHPGIGHTELRHRLITAWEAAFGTTRPALITGPLNNRIMELRNSGRIVESNDGDEPKYSIAGAAKVPETPMPKPVQPVEMRLKPPQMPPEPPISDRVPEPAPEPEESLGPLEAPVKDKHGVPQILLPPSAEKPPEISAAKARREMDEGRIQLTPQDIRQAAIEYNPMATFYASIWAEGGRDNLNKALKLQEEIKRLKAQGLGPVLDDYVRSGMNDAQAVEAVRKFHGV